MLLSVDSVNMHWFCITDCDLHDVFTILVLHSHSDNSREGALPFAAIIVFLQVSQFRWNNSKWHEISLLVILARSSCLVWNDFL